MEKGEENALHVLKGPPPPPTLSSKDGQGNLLAG